MAAIRIGVVGVGFGTTVHIPAFQSEGIEVVAVCARRPERANEAAERFGIEGVYTDYAEMLAHPGLDAVSIVTQAGLHHEMALAALDAGKHVLCEKPFAATLEQAQELAAKARASGRTAMIAHEFRYSPSRATIKELIDQGFIGEPRHLSVSLFMSFRRPPGAAPRPVSPGSSGMLGGLGSHYIDCMRDWFGDITSVAGSLRGQPVEGASLVDANSSFAFDAEFASGAWGTMACSFASPFGPGASVQIYGSEGSLQTTQRGANPDVNGIVLGARTDSNEALVEMPIPERLRLFVDDRDDRLAAFRVLTQRFVHGVEHGSSPAPNFDDGLACQRVMAAVQESSVSGKRVTVSRD